MIDRIKDAEQNVPFLIWSLGPNELLYEMKHTSSRYAGLIAALLRDNDFLHTPQVTLFESQFESDSLHRVHDSLFFI